MSNLIKLGKYLKVRSHIEPMCIIEVADFTSDPPKAHSSFIVPLAKAADFRNKLVEKLSDRPDVAEVEAEPLPEGC